MASGMNLNESEIRKILKMVDAGMSGDDIAEISGWATRTIAAISQAANAVRATDTETLKRLLRGNYGNAVGLTAKVLGVNTLSNEGAEEPKNHAEAKGPDNTALMWSAMLEAIKEQTKSVETLTATVKAMQLTLQGFRGDFSEKAKGIVEVINLNADYINKDIEKAVDHLGGIKQNTKKGGYHQP